MKKLSDYARENNISYSAAWRKFNKNEIPNASKLPNGTIVVTETSVASTTVNPFVQNPPAMAISVDTNNKVSRASTTTRRNGISTLGNPADRYANVRAGGLPYKRNSSVIGATAIDCREMVELCRQAYFNFSVVRNIVELMVEFTCSDWYMTGGNKTARDFFTSFWKKVGLKNLHTQFSREFWRSGNPFIVREEIVIKADDIRQMTQTFGLSAAKSVTLPGKYTILDPADIQFEGGSSFVLGQYSKVLNDYEMECLRNPRNQTDEQLFLSLPSEIQKAIKDKRQAVTIPLDMSKCYYIPFGKQDYEPFGVSIIWPVLDDIEWKAQMKKMDAAIARTVQQAILLITCGESPKDNPNGSVNQAQLENLQTIFQNESVGRVLIADYTTKAQFIIPQIADILDPVKYEVINQDIRDGLNNILIGGGGNEKFANKAVSLNVFIERLRSAREVFIENFLQPEIRRISELLGFRQIPDIKFTEINLKDELEFSRIYTRLVEIGVLTPVEGLTAIETGRLPSAEESLEHQKQHVEHKEEGYYQPLSGGLSDQKELAEVNNDAKMEQQQQKLVQQNGRPPGKGKPIKKKVKPIGGSTYSASKLKELAHQASILDNAVIEALRINNGLTKLNKTQAKVAKELAAIIISNETPENWINSITDYIKSPIDKNKEQVDEIITIASDFGLDIYSASLLYHARN
jgi:hypothetical protein